MCGVTGIVNLSSRQPVPEAWVRRMNASLAHRGPDGDGFHFAEGVGLGHRRLSIIDLESGKQPLYNEDGSVVVTYNGEIYNFKSLTNELERRGHTFRTRCDTEVIVHAWEEWGEACVDRFNGMFAFAVWDANRRCLFLARDRLGIKPLYYAQLGSGRFAFASELKAIMTLPELDRSIDHSAVEDYFAFGYIPDPKTIFASVKKLEPGHRLLVRHGSDNVLPSSYWDVPLDLPATSEGREDYAGIAADLKAAVQRRLVADVPLGAFLSGGIDSSAVVAMMRDIGVDHLLTCSIGFDEARFDESRYALQVAKAKCTDHRWERVEASDYELLDTLGSVYDEPFADSSAIPTYRVCQLARKHVTVALSGDGGDENFLGYRRYSLFRMEERLRAPLPEPVRRAVFGPL
ncbi:MAG: asparagine synthase (glutamine-hydrolyzing), partial [Pseudomonadales bacterium]